jgi:hypothetical protein
MAEEAEAGTGARVLMRSTSFHGASHIRIVVTSFTPVGKFGMNGCNVRLMMRRPTFSRHRALPEQR